MKAQIFKRAGVASNKEGQQWASADSIRLNVWRPTVKAGAGEALSPKID